MDWNALLNTLIGYATSLGIKILASLLIFVVGMKLIKKLKKWIKKTPKFEKLDISVRSFFANAITILLYIVLVITIAMILGIPTTSFITLLASCGVAVGLALQGALGNFAGGLMILIFRPFRVGDYIEASGEAGTVTDITVVYTVLKTPDNKKITIPNGSLTNTVIRNYSAENLRRVDLTFSTSYDSDIEKVKTILLDLANAHPMALKDPAPFARLASHDESALTYTLRIWCKNEDYWTVNFDMIEAVKKAFDENGIEIPYPQLDVHVNKTENN